MTWVSHSHSISPTDFLEAAPFFRSRGLGLINAAPIGMGLLARTIPEWHPAPDVTRQGVAAAIRHAEERGFDLRQFDTCYISQPIPLACI